MRSISIGSRAFLVFFLLIAMMALVSFMSIYIQ